MRGDYLLKSGRLGSIYHLPTYRSRELLFLDQACTCLPLVLFMPQPLVCTSAEYQRLLHVAVARPGLNELSVTSNAMRLALEVKTHHPSLT